MVVVERGPYPPEITRASKIDLSGKVAVVTGSSRGIGRAIALGLASYRADIVINSTEKSLPQAEEVKSEIEKMGRQAIIVTGDVAKEQTAIDIVSNAINKLGHIDILVNNAGTRKDGLLVKMTLDQWQGVMDTNLTSAFLVTREVVREMLRQRTKGGSVINISSIVAKIGNRGQTNYGASKAGLIGFTYSCAQEYEGRIRFNALALGLVETELTSDLDEKQKKQISKMTSGMVTKKEVVEQVIYLASNDSAGENGKLITLEGVAAIK